MLMLTIREKVCEPHWMPHYIFPHPKLNVAFTNTRHCLPKQPTAHLDWIITCQCFLLSKHLFSEQWRAVITLRGVSEGGNSANWAIRAEAGSGLPLTGACMGERHHARGDNSMCVCVCVQVRKREGRQVIVWLKGCGVLIDTLPA